MICSNCSRTIPDGSEICLCCKAKINTDVKRCPNCWSRVESEDIRCKKCGCHIEKMTEEIQKNALAKDPTVLDKLKRIPLWIRIILPMIIVCFAVGMYTYDVARENARNAEAAEMAEGYIISLNIAVDRITEMAQVYEDMVYDQSWLDHTGNASAVRDVYSQEISIIKKAREPLNYTKNQIANQENRQITEIVNEMYYNYTRLYGYVIGENGTYPDYIIKYKKILADYEASVKKLETEIQKYR